MVKVKTQIFTDLKSIIKNDSNSAHRRRGLAGKFPAPVIFEARRNVLNLLKCPIISGTKLMVTLCRKGALSVVVLITTGTILHPS